MKQTWVVFLFTLREAVRQKSFRILTIVVLVLILAACLGARIYYNGQTSAQAQTEEEASEDSTANTAETSYTSVCYYIDSEGLIPDGPSALEQAFPSVHILETSSDQEESLKNQIASNSDITLVVISPVDREEESSEAQSSGSSDSSQTTTANELQLPDIIPSITVYHKDFLNGMDTTLIGSVLTKAYINQVLTEAGVSEDVTSLLNLSLSVEAQTLGSMDMNGYILGILMTLLIFLIVFYYGYSVAFSIAREKSGRVMETLVVSAKPSHILVGKIMGMGMAGLLQVVAFLLFLVLCFYTIVPQGFSIDGMLVDLSHLNGSTVLLLLVYFLLGYSLYAAIDAVCGSAVSRMEDISPAMLPVILLSLASFYLADFTAIVSQETDSVLSKVCMYVPFISPFYMPFRILNQQIDLVDVSLSILFLLLAITLATAVCSRVYQRSVLHYGQRLKLTQIAKMSRDENKTKEN